MKKAIIILLALFSIFACSKDDNSYLKSRVFGQGVYVPILPEGKLLNFSPSSIEFGPVQQGTTQSGSITITNTCNYEINVLISSNDKELSSNVVDFKIDPKGTFVLNVLYSPSGLSYLYGKLSFSYGSVVQTVIIGGHGVLELETTLVAIPSGIIDFGDLIVGNTGNKSFKLTNTGSPTANWTNNRTEYTLSPPDGSISAGASQVVNVSFIPSAAGVYTNDIVIIYNGGTVKIPYRVNRIAATRILGVGCTSSTAFGNVPINTTATKVVTISNTGTLDLTISSIIINQPTAGIYTCNYSGIIPPGQSVNTNITFTPKIKSQYYSCTIFVESNKTSGSNSLQFSGKGI